MCQHENEKRKEKEEEVAVAVAVAVADMSSHVLKSSCAMHKSQHIASSSTRYRMNECPHLAHISLKQRVTLLTLKRTRHRHQAMAVQQGMQRQQQFHEENQQYCHEKCHDKDGAHLYICEKQQQAFKAATRRKKAINMTPSPSLSLSRRRALVTAGKSISIALPVSTIVMGCDQSKIDVAATAATAVNNNNDNNDTTIESYPATKSSDLFFPSSFQGLWECMSTEIDIETYEFASEEATRRRGNIDNTSVADKVVVDKAELKKDTKPPVFYSARFINQSKSPLLPGTFARVDGNVGDSNDNVILDRGFTTATLIEAEAGRGAVDRIDWSQRRPERTVIYLRGGIRAESIVINRKQFYTEPGVLHTVELIAQTIDNTKDVDGAPTRRLSENETIYSFDERNQDLDSFKAKQIISMFRVPIELGGDKAAPGSSRSTSSLYNILSSLTTLNQPTARYIFQVDFKRQQQQ